MIQHPPCHKCGKIDTVKLRRQVASNGASMVAWYCTGCNRWAENPVKWLAHPLLTPYLAHYGKIIDDVPLLADYTTKSTPCAICGRTDTEYNHWMPQMLASRDPVSSEWPQWEKQGAYLCRYHHALWHNLVTPWMPGRGQL